MTDRVVCVVNGKTSGRGGDINILLSFGCLVYLWPRELFGTPYKG
jgi:hypothetical protein